ncbi:hypothetical protein BH24ACI3_BH24ACI3_12710 [soil metagenome]
MTNVVAKIEMNSGATLPASVQIEPFTTLVVMPAVDGVSVVLMVGSGVTQMSVMIRPGPVNQVGGKESGPLLKREFNAEAAEV